MSDFADIKQVEELIPGVVTVVSKDGFGFDMQRHDLSTKSKYFKKEIDTIDPENKKIKIVIKTEEDSRYIRLLSRYLKTGRIKFGSTPENVKMWKLGHKWSIIGIINISLNRYIDVFNLCSHPETNIEDLKLLPTNLLLKGTHKQKARFIVAFTRTAYRNELIKYIDNVELLHLLYTYDVKHNLK